MSTESSEEAYLQTLVTQYHIKLSSSMFSRIKKNYLKISPGVLVLFIS